MSKLSEIVSRRRSSGQSRTGALFGSLKDKVKETIDPRQIFNQTGILTALFPSLKAYKADSKPQKFNNTGAPSWLDVKTKNVQVEKIEKNTEIFAKNSMYFSEIARDINVSRINVGKLVKLVSPAAAEKTDMYYKKTSEMEKSYESKFKSESKKSTRVDNKSKKSSFSWIKMIGLIGTVGVSYLLLDFIKNKEESIIKEIYDDLDEKFDSFKNNFLDFKEKAFIDFDKERIKLIDKLKSQTDDVIDTISKDFTFDSIYDYIVDGTGPLKKYAESVSEFKGKLAEAATNVFPAAAASALPVVTPKTDTGTGTPSLGRSTQTTPNAPTRSGTRTTSSGSIPGISPYAAFTIKSESGAQTKEEMYAKGAQIVDNDPKPGVKSYGLFGMNSGPGKSIQLFVKDNPQFGFQSNPPSAEFDKEWTNLAKSKPEELLQAQIRWHEKYVLDPIKRELKSLLPPGIEVDNKLIMFMSDRRNQYGGVQEKEAVAFASSARNSDEWIRKVTEYDLSTIKEAFPSYLENNPNNRPGLINRIQNRARASYEVSLSNTGSFVDNMSRVAVMKNANRGKEVLIVNRVNRETVSTQNQTEVDSIANTDDKRLNLLIAAASGSPTG
jgi:hypothetical protein